MTHMTPPHELRFCTRVAEIQGYRLDRAGTRSISFQNDSRPELNLNLRLFLLRSLLISRRISPDMTFTIMGHVKICEMIPLPSNVHLLEDEARFVHLRNGGMWVHHFNNYGSPRIQIEKMAHGLHPVFWSEFLFSRAV